MESERPTDLVMLRRLVSAITGSRSPFRGRDEYKEARDHLATAEPDPTPVHGEAGEASSLTFGAEELGRKLVALLSHERAMVREGALIGVGHVLCSIAQVGEMAKTDPSSGVKVTAAETLEEAPTPCPTCTRVQGEADWYVVKRPHSRSGTAWPDHADAALSSQAQHSDAEITPAFRRPPPPPSIAGVLERVRRYTAEVLGNDDEGPTDVGLDPDASGDLGKYDELVSILTTAGGADD